MTALHIATSLTENEHKIGALLKEKADKRAKAIFGLEPIHIAVLYGNIAAVTKLLDGAENAGTNISYACNFFDVYVIKKYLMSFKIILLPLKQP